MVLAPDQSSFLEISVPEVGYPHSRRGEGRWEDRRGVRHSVRDFELGRKLIQSILQKMRQKTILKGKIKINELS